MPFPRSVCALFVALLCTMACFGISQSAQAASLPYQASVVSLSAPATMFVGDRTEVMVELTNQGTATWKNTGPNYVALFHWDPKTKQETPSSLAAAGWISNSEVTKMPVASVAPGKSVQFRFPIQAPSTPGRYQANFTFAAQNLAWFKYGVFSLTIDVKSRESTSFQSTIIQTPNSILSPIAASTSEWAAVLVSRGGTEWQVEMENQATVDLTFKNVGTKTWYRQGEGFVSVYAIDNKQERKSLFRDGVWMGSAQVARIIEDVVRPGQEAHVRMTLRAPKIPGLFQETFMLAAENVAWITGSDVTIPIRVPMLAGYLAQDAVGSLDEIADASGVGGSAVTSTVSGSTSVPAASDPARTGQLLLRSATQMTVTGNASLEWTLGFKNTGTLHWSMHALRLMNVSPLSSIVKLSSVRDESWQGALEPSTIRAQTKPGELAFVTFRLKAPAKKGSYTARFQLHADGQPVGGAVIEIPITVTADGYIEQPKTTQPTPSQTQATPTPPPLPPLNAVPINGDYSNLPAEPIVRVGVFEPVGGTLTMRAAYNPILVLDGEMILCKVAMNESITVTFDRANKRYLLSGHAGCGERNSVRLFSFRAEDNVSPIELAPGSRPTGGLWNSTHTAFRRQIELRYTPATDKIWMINELPIEYYLKGMMETSDNSPPEFRRTLMTAARTYAVYHVRRNTKHANEFYTVDATYDQVYRGYGAEKKNPGVAQAIDDTRGQIATYEEHLAVTPYFSRSDGRTRNWNEVWAGEAIPWLVSVPVPWDAGKTLWGHGVGMSASGALGMANDGKRYDEILKYFYRGIELRRAYK